MAAVAEHGRSARAPSGGPAAGLLPPGGDSSAAAGAARAGAGGRALLSGAPVQAAVPIPPPSESPQPEAGSGGDDDGSGGCDCGDGCGGACIEQLAVGGAAGAGRICVQAGHAAAAESVPGTCEVLALLDTADGAFGGGEDPPGGALSCGEAVAQYVRTRMGISHVPLAGAGAAGLFGSVVARPAALMATVGTTEAASSAQTAAPRASRPRSPTSICHYSRHRSSAPPSRSTRRRGPRPLLSQCAASRGRSYRRTRVRAASRCARGSRAPTKRPSFFASHTLLTRPVVCLHAHSARSPPARTPTVLPLTARPFQAARPVAWSGPARLAAGTAPPIQCPTRRPFFGTWASPTRRPSRAARWMSMTAHLRPRPVGRQLGCRRRSRAARGQPRRGRGRLARSAVSTLGER